MAFSSLGVSDAKCLEVSVAMATVCGSIIWYRLGPGVSRRVFPSWAGVVSGVRLIAIDGVIAMGYHWVYLAATELTF